jgi:hypothetical protein
MDIIMDLIVTLGITTISVKTISIMMFSHNDQYNGLFLFLLIGGCIQTLNLRIS